MKKSCGNTRREMLRLISISAGATTGLTQFPAGAWQTGTTPALSRDYTPKIFDEEQLQVIECLSEIILPADAHSPGAKAAYVWKYIDLIVSQAGESAKQIWIDGLAALDHMATSDYGRPLGKCTGNEQTSLLEKISRREKDPRTLEERFFVVLKRATVDGYYTSEIGIHQDLEYRGNTMVLNFESCMHPEHKVE
jgi:hypothetical protein